MKYIVPIFIMCITFSSLARAKDKVVSVQITTKVQTSNGYKITQGEGNGFYVDKRLIATAKHIVEGKETVTVISDGRMMTGFVVYESLLYDIAFIKVYKRGDPLEFCRDVHVNDEYKLWLTSRGPTRYKRGIVTEFSHFEMRGSTNVNKGDSGAPALLNKTNCVLGMLIKRDNFTHGSRYTTNINLQNALNDYKKKNNLNMLKFE